MKIKLKKLKDNAIAPTYGTSGAACFDLYSANETPIEISKSAIIPTGLAFEIPEGYVMNVFSRSGHGFKNDVRLANCVGKIDADYRGEVMLKLTLDDENAPALTIQPGERIAQAEVVPVHRVEAFEFVDELSSTDRGAGGFGSTGK